MPLLQNPKGHMMILLLGLAYYTLHLFTHMILLMLEVLMVCLVKEAGSLDHSLALPLGCFLLQVPLKADSLPYTWYTDQNKPIFLSWNVLPLKSTKPRRI